MSRKHHMVFIDTFSSGLDEMPRKLQKDAASVLRVLHAKARFSVFEATANQTIAKTVTNVIAAKLVETDNSCGYPWTKVKLTPAGLAAIEATR